MEEDHKPFIMAKGKDPDPEETNISLDLSLSLGNTSSSTTTTSTYDHKGEQEIHYRKLELPTTNYRESNMMFMEIKKGTDDDISLQLSLFSGDDVSSGTTTIPDRKGKQPMTWMEIKSSGALSSESDSDTDTDDDISLALSLSLNDALITSKKRKTMEKGGAAMWSKLSDSDTNDYISLALSLSLNQRFEVGEGSTSNINHNLKPNDALITSKKRQTLKAFTSKKRQILKAFTSKKRQTLMGNPNRKYKRAKVETVSTELRLGHDPWCIKKKLYPSDIGDMSRLMIASDLVEAHVLPNWNADQQAQIKKGVPVLVRDCDTNTVHQMKFKRWSSGANVLIKNWVPDFVKRRELQEGDEIGLYWDIQSSRFNFSVLSRAPRQ